MKMPVNIITYDVGTTGIKTCLFQVGESLTLLASEMEGYELYILKNGGAEQDPLEIWSAMCNTTRNLLNKTKTKPEAIAGISFCSQMQGLVLTDLEGNPLRRLMSYMDQRGGKELKDNMSHGIQISGVNLFKLIKSIRETGAVSASVKDPVWKYKWVENNEPDIFDKVYKWLDVKEFLICRCSGSFVMTEDSAFATLLYGIRDNKKTWSKEICSMLGVNINHLPDIKRSTDKVGVLTKSAAKELGLAEGTAVFGGGGDASLIGIGAGAVMMGDTHIYAGTSGWVSTVVGQSVVDPISMIAAIVGAQHDSFNYFAEMETAGKCFEWVKNHLAMDEIDAYLEKKLVSDTKESEFKTLYDYLSHVVSNVPAGSGNVIFTPWLHGNRCPFEDPKARGMFFNIGLETGKTELIRAVLEGICFHLRWMLEAQNKKIKTSKVIRFVGGGALSETTCQILSDVTGRVIETVESPQNAGAMGAAVVTSVGLGLLPSIRDAKKMVPAVKTFTPSAENKIIYDRNFKVFKRLYKNNKNNFRALNSPAF